MKVETRSSGSVHILDLQGKICFGDGEQEVEKSIAGCLAQDHRNIVVNLTRVTLIDSAGLGQMMAGKKRGLDRKAELRLVIPKDSPIPLVCQTCLQLVFQVFDDELSAVGSFAK